MTARGVARVAFAGALMAVVGLSPGQGRTQASLTAQLSLHDPLSGREIRPDGGAPVRLRVHLIDPVSGAAPRGVELLGWVRRADRDNSGCARAAQNFRATRKIPLGAVDLNGVLVTTLNRDASLSVIDPKLNLYSSNLVAAHTLDTRPAAMAVDARNMRALFADREAGSITAAHLSGPERSVVADQLANVGSLAVASNGAIWAGDGAGALHHLSPEGRTIDRRTLGNAAVTVKKQPDDENDIIGAFTAEGGFVMVEGTTGAVVMASDFGAPVVDASFVADLGAIAVLRDAPVAQLRYADAPETPFRVQLGARFARIDTGPDARIAVAWTPGDALVALIDMAMGQVVQTFALNDATVSAVSFTDNAAFILSHDGGFLGAIDLATVMLGKAAELRHVNLGARSERPEGDTALLVPLFPSPQVLAVEPANQTGWLVGEIASSVEMPPMDSIRMRGGVPHRVAIIDRSFQEVTTGIFETVWAFEPGRHELVLTTYAGELSTCVGFEVRGRAERMQLTQVQLRLEPDGGLPVAGRSHEIAFRIIGPDDASVSIPRMRLLVPSMRSGWSEVVVARAGDDGILRAELNLPHPGPYVVQPVGLPAPFAIGRTLVLDAIDTREETQ